MLYTVFAILFGFLNIVLILVVIIQKGQGGFGGITGASSQESSMLFGGSGGTDLLQKITWLLGFILMTSTLFLAIYKARTVRFGLYSKNKTIPSSSQETVAPSEENITPTESEQNSVDNSEISE